MSDAQVGRAQTTEGWVSCNFLGTSLFFCVWSLVWWLKDSWTFSWYLRAPKEGVPKEKESQAYHFYDLALETTVLLLLAFCLLRQSCWPSPCSNAGITDSTPDRGSGRALEEKSMYEGNIVVAIMENNF